MLRYKSRKEAKEAGVRFDGPDAGHVAPREGGGDLGKSLRWSGRGDEAEPCAPDTPTRGLPLRKTRGRRPDRQQHPGVGEPVGEFSGPFELDFPPSEVQSVDASLALGQPTDAGSRRTLLDAVALPMPPSINAYWGERVVWMKKHQRHMALPYVTHEGKAYQLLIRKLMLERQAWFRSPHPLALLILVCFKYERPQDLDNRVKVLQDALKNGNVMVDDKQVKRLEVREGPHLTPPVVFVRLQEILPDRVANLAWIRAPL